MPSGTPSPSRSPARPAVAETAAYRPMRNDRRDFDPMGADWGYVLDDTPADLWRELVAVRDRRASWPFQIRGQQPGHDGYWYARLSPDWCWCAWGAEYIGAHWNPATPSQVTCRVTITRYTATGGEHQGGRWTGELVLDLHEQSFTWQPCPRDLARGVPDDVTAEAGHKAAKLLAFFDAQIAQWRAGDTPRPFTAADAVS